MALHTSSIQSTLRRCLVSLTSTSTSTIPKGAISFRQSRNILLRRRSQTELRKSFTTTAAAPRNPQNASVQATGGTAADKIHVVTNTSSHSFKVNKLYYDGSSEKLNLQTSELLKSAQLYARDLLTLNLTSRQERLRAGSVRRGTVSEINPRESLIILSFGNVRAVAGLDYIFLFDAHNLAVKQFADELAETYRSGGMEGEPPELVFLEAVLKDTVEIFGRRLRMFEPMVDSFVDRVTNELYKDSEYTSLVPIKDSLQAFEIKVTKSFDCLTYLLNHDDVMLGLLLTEQAEARRRGGEVDFSRHEHVELLLGVYARQINNILMEIRYLLKRLQSKQEFLGLAMSSYRNRMVRMNLHIGITALSLGFGTTIAGFFGMNLISGLENSPAAFVSVVGLSGIGGGLIAAGSMSHLGGRAMKERASRRMEENETLTSALSDMTALDFTIKAIEKSGGCLDKDQFRTVLENARESKQVSSNEVDLLFEIFDTVKDGYLTVEDFKPQEKWN